MTAASLAYSEGVMVGINVYDTVYKEALAAGNSKEQAEKNAATQSAWRRYLISN